MGVWRRKKMSTLMLERKNLINVKKDEYTPFLLYGKYYLEHCRPVRRDEVNFYEDRRNI